jgi:phenylpropionate dioxygenase-like ring-hydroxylating dioxygenase large terminal subunit
MAAQSTNIQALREELGKRLTDQQMPRAMPAECYISSDYLALERDQLFRKQWICVGHAGEIPKPGDFYTTELIDEQLVVVRDKAGQVKVLSNVCRHRGNVVARGAGHTARFTCGYHGWTYGIDGHLLAAPLMQENAGFQKAQCRLHEFRCELWQEYIFVNLDGAASSLGEALEPIAPVIKNYHPAEQNFLFGAEEVWNTNWKCVVENFMEGYHLSPLHPTTLHPITPTILCEKLPNGAAFTGYRSNFNPACPERGPYHPDLSEKERRSDVFYAVFPSFVVGFCPHFTLYMCTRPLTPDTVAIRWGITGNATDPASKVVTDYVQLCKDFCAEDRRELEQLQKGLKSRYYQPGPLAPDNFEGTVRDIVDYMARHLGVKSEQASLK